MTRNSDLTNSRAPAGYTAVSAHAEYRRDHYFFARHQSRAAEALEWQDDDDMESRGPGPGLIVAIVLLVICGLGFMLWEESVSYAETGGHDTHRPLVERSATHFEMGLGSNQSFLSEALTMLQGHQDMQPLFTGGIAR